MNPNPISAIIGSSSGMGRALAEAHKRNNTECVLFSSHPDQIEGFNVFQLDLTDEQSAQNVFDRAFSQYANIDTIYILSGRGDVETSPCFNSAKSTIDLNCTGFTLAAYRAANHLEARGCGRLIAVTSVAAIRGGRYSPSYNASKSYQSSLLEGLRCRFTHLKLPISVTEIRAGFVNTSMMKAEKPFWVASPEQAAENMLSAAKKRKEVAYILPRWKLIGWAFSIMPRSLYKRIG